MKELRKCRECKQLFTPYYENDHLCNRCFRLEDDPSWNTNNNKESNDENYNNG